MVTFERLDYDYSDMTDAQREFLRNLNPQVRVTKQSNTSKTIHLDSGNDTICEHNIDSRLVDVSKYPLGYLDWCTHCLARAKEPKTKINAGNGTSKETVTKAIQYANQKTKKEITMSKYKELGITPSVWTIQQVFGTWSKAKEHAL